VTGFTGQAEKFGSKVWQGRHQRVAALFSFSTFSTKESAMLFCEAVAAANASTTDAGKITLGGGYRPASTKDTGKIILGGGYRLPATADAGKITLGGGYRLPVQGS
jgi:hypothetical protein